MNSLPNHSLPSYTEESAADALFHYTTANGLIGILTRNELWSTAYWCANDESELVAGRDVLTPIFRSLTHELIKAKDPLVQTFESRGVDIRSHADSFENRVLSLTFSMLSAYITCFCKPAGKEDFLHGLLSQWRGYGTDGGYAIQFSRKKLEAEVVRMHDPKGFNHELRDVHYSKDNPLKDALFAHRGRYEQALIEHLHELAKPINLSRNTMRNPIAGLLEGPLEALLDYMIHTKNLHFSEERECRLSILQSTVEEPGLLPLQYFNRQGLVVPYIRTNPEHFDILGCVEWIIVGPGPRMGARFNSVAQIAKKSGRKIFVRPSHIPLARQ